MKKYNPFFFLFFVLIYSNVSGQNAPTSGLFNFEIYGGPSKSYFSVDIQDQYGDMSLYSPIDVHLGVNVLTKLTDTWQLSLQGEYVRRPVGSKQIDPNGQTISRRVTSFDNTFFTYSLGARYNLYKGRKALFFQPSAGLAVNKVSQGLFYGGSTTAHTTLTLRAEAGVKFYNKRNNYFVVGIRHQQGMNTFDRHFIPLNNSYQRSIDFRSKGSFTGLFVGYGINTDKNKK